MSDTLDRFNQDYAAAFSKYLGSPNEKGLQAAYELGRRAMNDDLSTLNIAEVHHQEMAAALDRYAESRGIKDVAKTAAAFFCESLSTFEMTRRGYFEAQRLYERERGIADTLQQSLLPLQLPEIPGVEVETLYRPGGSGQQVGGDFYDLFELNSEAWAVLVGDVVGKGPQAAALTGLARHTIRAAALRTIDPIQVIDVLNEAIVRYGSGDFCTLIYGHLFREPTGARLDMTCGGHPLPLLLRSDGSVGSVHCEGALLGVMDDPGSQISAVDLKAGDAIVLYSDGVTEARTPAGLFGEERLAGLLESCKGYDAGKIVGKIADTLDELQDSDRKDDVAIVVLRVLE